MEKERNRLVLPMFGDIMSLSHIEVLVFLKTALKFGIRYKAKQSCIAKLYKQHECTLNRFEFLVLYSG